MTEVIEIAERVTGRAIRTRVTKRRPGDPPRLVGDASLARETLRWTPDYAALETIVEHAWVWHQKRFGNRGITRPSGLSEPEAGPWSSR